MKLKTIKAIYIEIIFIIKTNRYYKLLYFYIVMTLSTCLVNLFSYIKREIDNSYAISDTHERIIYDGIGKTRWSRIRHDFNCC